MRPIRFIPDNTRFGFMRWRRHAFAFTLVLTLLSLGSLLTQGLNLGLDFVGGILVEARASAEVDLPDIRARLEALDLGEAVIQTFDDSHDVLVRIQEQPGGPEAQARAIDAIKSVLQPGFEIRRTEFVGPQVSQELLRGGLLATLLAVGLIGVYVWFRFEWQFGLSAVLTTFHDVFVVLGLFSLFHLEFNLTVVAALLTVAGYSINDTVVVFDRVRENLRLFKTMPLLELLDRTVNQTLSRTVLTAGTTLIAVLALLFFGGTVLRNFALAITIGILIGTYSSIFVASALLLYLPSPRITGAKAQAAVIPSKGDPKATA